MPYDAKQHELEILEHWKKTNAFERSVSERPADQPYVFYDGPPFATGLPHYGHLVPGVMKDAVPRYWTMQGKRVERVWGWDCHGLPIENIVEKELGFTSKHDIIAMGVEQFNELCRSKIDTYVEEWKQVIHRFGRWVDMDHAYWTMDVAYMESVWSVFKQLWEKQLIYQGYKPMHICPRCETTLSQQEVSEGYKDIADISVTAQFLVTGDPNHVLDEERNKGSVYFLAWTTTPWTLPGNVLLAVGEKIEYAVVLCDSAYYIVAKDLVEENFEGKTFQVVDQKRGKDLVGLMYEPLFPYFAESPNSFRVIAADMVTTNDGTGIVHLAPAFGSEDYEIFKQENVPFIQHVQMNGRFTDDVVDFKGLHVKPAEDHTATDVAIVKWLAHHGKLFAKKKYTHSYPHCWRCDTPLLNYAAHSWFVDVTKLKSDALEQAKKINWSPAHIKEGRFGMWLEGAKDWSISRQRFWATPIPLWQCANGLRTTDDGLSRSKHRGLQADCQYVVVGSVAELEVLSGKKVTDLHKHVVDTITFSCPSCGGTMTRIPDVLDTWFDSGSMPYAQLHYPFENQEKFDAGFPAEFIAEGQDQTRAWFYYLHILATALKGSPAFQHVIVNGIVLAEDGKKMSKKLKNYPDPTEVIDRYGADALRYYLLTSPVVAAESLNFSEAGVREVFNKVVNTLWNVVEFYRMFADGRNMEHGTGNMEHRTWNIEQKTKNKKHVLDRWILARLEELLTSVTEEMHAYRLNEAVRPIMDFISDLSQWYVRRSRDRFKGDDDLDKQAATDTLRFVLLELSKIMAPFTPFIAEKVYQAVGGELDSVHLERWREHGTRNMEHGTGNKEQENIISDMQIVRKIVEMGHALRKEAGIPVRQPLLRMQISECRFQNDEVFFALIEEELNVKEVMNDDNMIDDRWMVKEDGILKIALNTTITDDLKKEGLLRELVRAINQMRKDAGLTPNDRIRIFWKTDDEMIRSVFHAHQSALADATLADAVEEGGDGTEVSIGDGKICLHIEK